MSNHLAAAAVTATLRKLLQTACDTANPAVAQARVTTLRPNAQTGLTTPGVNLFLYQAVPAAPVRNIDVPTRRPDGSIIQRPSAGLELHYLISFTGDDAKLEPQFLMGIVTRALHTNPVITRQNISDMIGDPTFNFMSGTDLQSAPDLVRLTPVPFSLDELSKLWSVVFQTPYVLSLVYRAAVVFIDGLVAPQPALPVRAAVVGVNASLGPVVDRLLAQATPTAPVVDDQPILSGQYLVLVGRNLMSEIVRVRVGATELTPDGPSMSQSMLKVQLPATLLAGAQTAVVVQRPNVKPSGLDLQSPPVPFLLQPQITAAFAGGSVTVHFTPPIGQTQALRLLLNQVDEAPGAPPKVYSFDVPPRTPAAPQASLTIAVPGVGSGRYLVRVSVDGAESPLGYDPVAGRYAAPLVTVP